MQAFMSAGASPRIGARLGMILREAGLAQVNTFGVAEPGFRPEQRQDRLYWEASFEASHRSLSNVESRRRNNWGLKRRWRAVSPRSSNGQTRCCYRRPWSVPGESPPRFDPCHARNVLLLDQGKTLASGLKLRVAMVSFSRAGSFDSSTNTDASSTTARR